MQSSGAQILKSFVFAMDVSLLNHQMYAIQY